MSEKYTVPEKLLLAALKLREGSKTFSAEDLVVAAWQMFPDTFGLAGYADKHPDSNRVLTNIMGTKGMRGKSWLRKVGEKQYHLTSTALNDVELLLARHSHDSGDTKQEFARAELDRGSAQKLERLLSTSAARKALGKLNGDVSFNDACGFWDITARSNANTLNTRLSEVTVLLERTKKALVKLGDSEGIRLPTQTLTQLDVEALIHLHIDLQETYKAELGIIKKRTDERVGKRLS